MIQVTLDRAHVVRRTRALNVMTIGWNVVEGVVAVVAGVAAGSVSLVGFGLDSAIEVSAALVLTWRIAQERHGGCTQGADRRAQQAVALSFAALAAYVGVVAVSCLVSGTEPDVSRAGMTIAGLSLVVMPVLARMKRVTAAALGSRAAAAEATQTELCTALSAALLVGLAAHGAFGWWWADPLAAIFIAIAAGWMAWRTWTADSLADTCCA